VGWVIIEGEGGDYMGMHEHKSKKGVWAHEDHMVPSMLGGHGHGPAKYVGPVEEEARALVIDEIVAEEAASQESLLILTVKCKDDIDVSDLAYMLFGPYSDAKEFGEEVTKREFTLTRVNSQEG